MYIKFVFSLLLLSTKQSRTFYGFVPSNHLALLSLSVHPSFYLYANIFFSLFFLSISFLTYFLPHSSSLFLSFPCLLFLYLWFRFLVSFCSILLHILFIFLPHSFPFFSLFFSFSLLFCSFLTQSYLFS